MIRALLSCGPSINSPAGVRRRGRAEDPERAPCSRCADARRIDGTAQGAELRKPRIEARDILVLEREMLAPAQARIDAEAACGRASRRTRSRAGVASAGLR